MVLTEEERRERHRLANKSYYQRQKERICRFYVITASRQKELNKKV